MRYNHVICRLAEFWELTWAVIKMLVILGVTFPMYMFPGIMIGWGWYEFSQWALTLPWHIDLVLLLLIFVRKRNWWKFLPLFLYIPITFLRISGIAIPFKGTVLVFGLIPALAFYSQMFFEDRIAKLIK